VFSERCVSRPEGAALERKLERWRRISLEAAKQCGRAIVPEIRRPLDFNDAVKAASSADVPIFCYEGDGTKPLSALLAGCDGRGASISLFIGSEGGFSIDEADAAVKAGMAMASLGRRILRTETAAAFTLACISYEYER
jgi:16S rRNA (uracil1498-N3)-methyltransferase